MTKLSILEYLNRMIKGEITDDIHTHMHYPTQISKTLGINIIEVGLGTATVQINTTKEKHSNQQGTIHGGLLCELADAAIGTAHSTVIPEGETFTSVELKINFYSPVFDNLLTAKASPLHSGKNLSHYVCDIFRSDGKKAAMVTSTVMTLRGDKATGR
ncbi:Putative esterase [Chryseobacterium oranimense G311]|uniref:PaaI family thioesterase n=1 Tax=Chryseobacterium oranimense TaxID=421058 RepID=UPI00053390A6|nr:PaaI family thioesterase [Chryseobacterium oranimense]CEJ72049.1 Putative esterase [Chryseobacterium oranimense G311]